MKRAGMAPVWHGREISDTHARGLRRDLFRGIGASLAPQVRTLLIRLRNVRLPQPSVREALAVYSRTRRSLRACSQYFTERRTPELGTQSCAILLHPAGLKHDDGIEPVLVLTTILMIVKDGRVTVDARRCGRISHHAIERMYQRLRTSSHDVVLAEVRSALRVTALLQTSAFLSRRSAVVQQLPVPTAHGVLRCIRDPEELQLEVRTFTLCKPGDRADESVATIRSWAQGTDIEDGDRFAALLRDPANRWWREKYRSREVATSTAANPVAPARARG